MVSVAGRGAADDRYLGSQGRRLGGVAAAIVVTPHLWDVLGVIADVWLALAFLMIVVVGMMMVTWAWRRI
jgi:hypothetical protein